VIVFILYLALLGLVAGGIARWAVPGPDPMGILGTIALGLGGAFLGGLVAWFLLGHAGGFLFAILGSIVLLILYRKFVQHRPITGPGARQLPPR
jgi:uncharacterized membrane protein YeaQ/YmgE (transglycosylase-associated protein family)